jgi:anti-sigma factor RsiW
MVDCGATRRDLLDHQRGRLAPEQSTAIAAHLETCADCADHDAAERALTEVLERQLPQYPASLAVKRDLADRWRRVRAAPRLPWTRRARAHPRRVAAVAAVLGVLVTTGLLAWRYDATARRAALAERMVAEAVNDHVRVAARPLGIESANIHQVRPWFTGRLDLAPAVAFPGDEEFPLRGGAVERFIDRPAAVIIYGRRLHTISLLVFAADGLPWPGAGSGALGDRPMRTATARGFNVVLWRAGDLGYALVSDVSTRELLGLATRLTGPGDRPRHPPLR